MNVLHTLRYLHIDSLYLFTLSLSLLAEMKKTPLQLTKLFTVSNEDCLTQNHIGDYGVTFGPYVSAVFIVNHCLDIIVTFRSVTTCPWSPAPSINDLWGFSVSDLPSRQRTDVLKILFVLHCARFSNILNGMFTWWVLNISCYHHDLQWTLYICTLTFTFWAALINAPGIKSICVKVGNRDLDVCRIGLQVYWLACRWLQARMVRIIFHFSTLSKMHCDELNSYSCYPRTSC